jgi:hypothetical protein
MLSFMGLKETKNYIIGFAAERKEPQNKKWGYVSQTTNAVPNRALQEPNRALKEPVP